MNSETNSSENQIEVVDILDDYYFQLILLQYALKSVDREIAEKKISLLSRASLIAGNGKSQLEVDLLRLQTVSRFLKLWSDALNEICPNPGQ